MNLTQRINLLSAEQRILLSKRLDDVGVANTGEKRLVAYVIGGSETPKSNELKPFVQSKLPDYMTPGVFVFLPAFPLTPNGKVDRNALPAPGEETPEANESFIEPRTPIEQKLGEIWREVLRVERISVTDNFFALGGHSLLAIQMLTRIRDEFQTELPLRVVFDAPTLESLTETLLEQLLAAQSGEEGAITIEQFANSP